MQIIRRSIQNQGLSEQSAGIVLSAWKPPTVKQYEPYLTKWSAYCGQTRFDSIHSSVSQVWNFLTTLHVCFSGSGWKVTNTISGGAEF